jgi:hypothetical protein
MHNLESRLLDFMQVLIEQLIASTVPMEENRTNDSVTQRICDSATPTAARPRQAHPHVKRAPQKDPASSLDGKI